MYQTSLATALLAFLHISSTAASCTSFTPSSSGLGVTSYDQAYIISYGVVCNSSVTSSLCPSGDGTYGCAVLSTGSFVTNGYTNLSLSAAESAPLYALLHSLPPNNGSITPLASLTTCTNKQNLGCLKPGEAGYLEAIPQLNCISGTLEGCTDGPVESGTGINICGPVDIGPPGNPTELTTGFNYVDNGYLVKTSAQVALGIKPNDTTTNATCEAQNPNDYTSAAPLTSLSSISVAIALGVAIALVS